jgi:hypothetical protein
MSAPNSVLDSTDPVIDLRRKHQGFLARISSNPPSADEIAAFMGELQAAGRNLPDITGDKRRGAVRNMLFYWAGDAIARGHHPKDASLPQLAEFVGKRNAEGSAGAEPKPEVISDEQAGQAKPETEPQSPTSTPEVQSPQGGTELLKDGPSKKSPGLGGLISSMLGNKSAKHEVSNPAGGVPGTGIEPTGSVEKPQDNKPLTDVEAIARARISLRYAGSARQWKQTPPEKQADYLLTGNRLAEASLYVDDDPDIRAHVEASKKAQKDAAEAEIAAREAAHALRNKQQKQRIAFLSVLVVVTGVAALAFWDKNQRLESAIAARDKADREKAAAFEALEDPELRRRQSERQQTIAPPTASNVSEVPRRPVPPSAKPEEVPVPSSVAEPCSGYLWLGSPGDSRLLNGQSPATLKPGDKVTIGLANDIRLRETAPSFNYQMGRQNGLVPGGTSVTIDSVLEPYQRQSGPQYWAQVLVPRQFCTSVFVQYAGAMPARLDTIKGELLNIGVQAPPAEEIASARGKAEVRYYWASDLPVAQQVATALGKFTKDGKPLRLTPLIDFPPAAKARATTIEVWLDLDLLKP